MFFKRSLHLFITALLIVVPATGQTPVASKQETASKEQKPDDAQTKLTAQALELLDAVLKDAEQLRLPQNRVYVSLMSAELLWNHDEQTARVLLKNAMADFRAILAVSDDGKMPQAYRQRMERSQLREKILFALARHDARLARAFLAETRSDAPPNPELQVENEGALEVRLAMVIAANDPAQALEMAQKSLAKGFTYALPELVSKIHEKDPDAAAQLTGDILTKLKTANLITNPEAASVALRIFQLATEPQKSKAKSGTQDAKPLLTEQSLRELAEIIASAALNVPTDKTVGSLDVSSIMKQLDKYAPSRTAQLRRMSSQEGGDEIEEQEPWQQYQQLMESGTPETLMEAADKAEPGLRDAYYRQAALKLVSDGKSDRARQVITDHIKDPNQRQQMLAEIDKQSLTAAATRGEIDETRKLLSRAGTNEERITILAQLAMAVSQKGDKKVALQLLEEARNLSTGRARYSRQLVAQLLIARGYASVDVTQSFAILEPSIDQLNELVAAAILLGEFFGEEEVVRDDELLVQPVSQVVEMFQQLFGKDLSLLATSNFTRTRDAAEKFQRFEVRLMARLLVAQSVLSQKDDEPNGLLKTTEGDKPIPVSPETPDANTSKSP